MEAEALINDVCCDDPGRVSAALQVAHGRGAELVPMLVQRFESVLKLLESGKAGSPPYVGFLFYLAAEFRACSAHRGMTQILRLPTPELDLVLGDAVTEGGCAALADTCNGSLADIFELIGDVEADPFARGAGVGALALLWKRGTFPRAELLVHLSRFATSLDPENDFDELVGNGIVETAVKVNAHEIRETILGLYERGLAEDTYYEYEYSETHLHPDSRSPREAESLDRTIDDAWEAVKDWAFFKGDVDDEESAVLGVAEPNEFQLATRTDDLDAPSAVPLPFRATPKVGRNELCPCGSGKKYKKCCGR